MLGVERAEEEPRERGILTLDEVKKLLALEMTPRLKAVLALGSLAGLRKGEIRGLKWDDVDFEHKALHVRHNWVNDREGLKSPKTKSSGSVLMLDLLARRARRPVMRSRQSGASAVGKCTDGARH